MTELHRNWVRGTLLLAASCAVLSGCMQSPVADVSQAPTTLKPVPAIVIGASAGMPVKTGDFAVFQTAYAKMPIPFRPDPFALLPAEKNYEAEQLAENIVNITGGHLPMYYNEPPIVEPNIEVEPQPYRRLAGIIIGDSITALLDNGNGQLIEIHPGMRIPATEWMVQSIDLDKAVLRRVGSRKLPQEVIVHLESPPGGGVTPQGPTQPTTSPTQQAAPPPGRGGASGD